jgi:hypothetical protein
VTELLIEVSTPHAAAFTLWTDKEQGCGCLSSARLDPKQLKKRAKSPITPVRPAAAQHI